MIPDLRLSYMVTDRETVTVHEVRAQIIRVFAAHFVENQHGHETELLKLLCETLCLLLTAAAEMEADENDTDEIDTTEFRLTKNKAEACYVEAGVKALVASGWTEEAAREETSWPDILPLDTNWDKSVLQELARIEVGHTLVSMDYCRAMVKRRHAEEAQANGSVQ